MLPVLRVKIDVLKTEHIFLKLDKHIFYVSNHICQLALYLFLHALNLLPEGVAKLTTPVMELVNSSLWRAYVR